MAEESDARSFEGRTAIITGAASGIGRQVAIDLARRRANVVLTDIDSDGLEVVASELDAGRGKALTIRCDVTDSRSVEEVVKRTISQFGAIEILVNSAGLLLSGTIEETTDDRIDTTLDINLKGVMYFIRSVTPHMKQQRYGKIINLSSIVAKNGDSSTIFAYGASKGAVMTLTRSVARQLGPYNVNVNAVAPHAVMTPMMSYWDEDKKTRAAAMIPLRRLATAEDVASVIVFLSSADASFITGETININGGFYMD